MAAPVVVILAAGQGTRMRSRTPKLLHEICGREMIWWPLTAAREAGAGKLVVVDSPSRPLAAVLHDEVEAVVQEETRGTGDALAAAKSYFIAGTTVLALNGDVPLIGAETLRRLTAAHETSAAAATMLTAVIDDPSGYGRVVRDESGEIERVVETGKPGDATTEELEIREVNTGIYAFDGGLLGAALAAISNDNAQGEYYLPDVLPVLRSQGHRIGSFELGDPIEMFNVNDRRALAQASAVAQQRINETHMLAGVTMIDPGRTVVDVGVRIAPDVTILPGCALKGRTLIGEGSTIGPHTTLIDTEVGDEVSVIQSYATEARIGDRANVGPFSYLRPGAVLGAGAKAGAFVEIKNSHVGAGSKVPHLSYIGDTEIGEDTNLGAATVTANYDGYVKHRTKIGSRVHTGVDTTLVAPVTIGDDAWTGAGSVITEDVPDGSLGLARERQTNLEGYDERVKSRHD